MKKGAVRLPNILVLIICYSTCACDRGRLCVAGAGKRASAACRARIAADCTAQNVRAGGCVTCKAGRGKFREGVPPQGRVCMGGRVNKAGCGIAERRRFRRKGRSTGRKGRRRQKADGRTERQQHGLDPRPLRPNHRHALAAHLGTPPGSIDWREGAAVGSPLAANRRAPGPIRRWRVRSHALQHSCLWSGRSRAHCRHGTRPACRAPSGLSGSRAR